MSVPGIEGLGFTPYVAPTVPSPGPAQSTQGTQGTQSAQGAGQAFGDMVLDGLDRLEAVQDKADQLSVQAATFSSAATRRAASTFASTTATSWEPGSCAYFCAWKRPR